MLRRSVDSLAILEEDTKAFRPVLVVPSVNPVAVLNAGDETFFSIAFPGNGRHQLSVLVVFFQTLLAVRVPFGRSPVSFSVFPV